MPAKKDESVSPELTETLEKLRVKLTAAYKSLIEQAMSTGSLSLLKSRPEGGDSSKKPEAGSQSKNGDPASVTLQLHASIKRTLKIVLSMLKRESMLGDPLNFKTVKDELIFGAIRDAYKKDDQAPQQQQQISRQMSSTDQASTTVSIE